MSSPPSALNIVLLYLSLMGLGAMGGYGAFYHLFSERCSKLVSQTEDKHSASRLEFQSKYEEALEGQRQCLADSTAKRSDMAGRLEAQSNLADRHYELLKQQEDTLARLSTTQLSQEESMKLIASLRDDLATSREQMAESKLGLQSLNAQYVLLRQEKDASEAGLKKELESTKELLQHQAEDLAEVNEEVKECDRDLPLFREEAAGLKNYLRTRNHQQCKMEYGKGPFILKFVLKFPQTLPAEPNEFDVELAPLSEMPHTIFTLLDLVDLQLFDGTALIAADGNKIEGGSPNSASSTQQSVKLHERYAKFGYHRSPLGFNEYSREYPHEKFTIGFTKNGQGGNISGPSLAINLQDNTEARDGEPCFGKVVRGQDTLLRIAKAPKAADGYRLAMNVDIVSVRLVRKPPPARQAAAAKQQ